MGGTQLTLALLSGPYLGSISWVFGQGKRLYEDSGKVTALR